MLLPFRCAPRTGERKHRVEDATTAQGGSVVKTLGDDRVVPSEDVAPGVVAETVVQNGRASVCEVT